MFIGLFIFSQAAAKKKILCNGSKNRASLRIFLAKAAAIGNVRSSVPERDDLSLMLTMSSKTHSYATEEFVFVNILLSHRNHAGKLVRIAR